MLQIGAYWGFMTGCRDPQGCTYPSQVMHPSLFNRLLCCRRVHALLATSPDCLSCATDRADGALAASV